MIKLLETDYDALEYIEKKATDSDLDCYPIENLFDFLLSVAYEDTIIFISSLLKSNKFIKEEKPQKKKKGSHAKKNSKSNEP